MKLSWLVARKKAIAVAAGIVVVFGVTLGVLASQQALPGTVTAGPLHDAHEGAATGLALKPSGVWTAVVEATFEGDEPAHVTALKLLPVPGFPVPTVRATGYITEGGVGSETGWPDRNFIHEPLMHATIRPTDNRAPHMAGIMLVLQAGTKRAMYAIEGVQVEYTIGSTKHQSRLYTAVTGCVPPPHKRNCPDRVIDEVYNRMVKDSGD